MFLNSEDVSGVHDLANYLSRDDDRGGLQVIRDTESLEASYERYLHSAVLLVPIIDHSCMVKNRCLDNFFCWHLER